MSKIELNIAKPKESELPMPSIMCNPFIVTRIDGDKKFIVILSGNTSLFFDISSGEITWAGERSWLIAKYKFVRFLEEGESFTYTK